MQGRAGERPPPAASLLRVKSVVFLDRQMRKGRFRALFRYRMRVQTITKTWTNVQMSRCTSTFSLRIMCLTSGFSRLQPRKREGRNCDPSSRADVANAGFIVCS